MIIVNVDQRNVSLVFDLLQAKILTSLIRQITPEQGYKAVSDLMKGGFDIGPSDVVGVTASVSMMLGAITDQIQKVQPQDSAPTPNPFGQNLEGHPVN
jgi:hypothetical protein